MERFVIGLKHPEKETSQRASFNTPHATPRHGMSYGSRMMLAFVLTSLLTVAILIAVVTTVWGGAFSDYTRANVEEIASIASTRLAEGYSVRNAWTSRALTAVAESNVLGDDIGMQVMDANGRVMYDDTWPAAAVAAWLEPDAATDAEASDATAKAPQASVGAKDAKANEGTPNPSLINKDAKTPPASSKSAHSPVSTAPTDAESAVTVPIADKDGKKIGTLRLWVLGSDALLTKADTAFRARTINAVSLAAVVAVIAAVIVGSIMSGMFTRPISIITEAARRLREGDLSARTNLHGADEINQLGETFDEMAGSLERDLKRERRLTSDVAHELRTPLMAMQATVEAMQDGVYPADYEHLETVASETRRLARLVQQTLDLSRQENHAAPLRLDQVDIVQLTQTIVNNEHRMFHNKGLHLRFVDETQGRSAIITCDSDMITQCIINLMSNAMRYTPEDGWVAVSVLGDRKYVCVSVSDTGIGIAKEDLARIFGRFYRTDSSRAREAGGLGVGLAVTKQIVERHHGFIAVESELEKGTTFTIHLPRKLELDAPSSTMTY